MGGMFSKPKAPSPPPKPKPEPKPDPEETRIADKKKRGKKTQTDYTGKLGLTNAQKSDTALKQLTGQ